MDVDIDIDLKEPPAGWLLIDPRTRLFRCPVAGCIVTDLDREYHLEWHLKMSA